LNDRRNEAITLINIGRVFLQFVEPDSALTQYLAALALNRSMADHASEAATLSIIGDLYSSVGQRDSAIVYLREALVLHRAAGNRRASATSHNSIGTAYYRSGQTDSALRHFHAALPLYRAIGDSASEAATLGNIAVTFSLSGYPDSALTFYRAALLIHHALKDRAEAATLAQIGDIFHHTGHRDSALVYYRSALLPQRAVGDRHGQALTLSSIGGVYDATGRPDSALTYFRAALALSQSVGDRAVESTILQHMGLVYANLFESDSALAYYRAALRLSRITGQRAGEAITLGNIGAIYLDAGQRDSALTYFRAALVLDRATGNRSAAAATLNNIGLVQQHAGQSDSALSAYRSALEVARASGNRSGEASTLNNIGLLHHDLGRVDSALAAYRAALPLEHAIGDRSGEATTLNNVAMLYLDVGKPDSALAVVDSAVVLFAKIRMHAGSDFSAVAFAEARSRVTADLWVRSWLATGTGQKAVTSALAAAERGRAQGLRDLLARLAGPNEKDALWASDTLPGADLVAEAEMTLAPLRKARTAVLYYSVARDTLATWLLGPTGDLRLIHHAAINSDSLAALVAVLRAGLGADAARTRMARGAAVEQERVVPNAARTARGVEDGASAESSARLRAATTALGTLLPPDLSRVVPAGSDLVIVPHGALGLVPFGALTAAGDTLPLGMRYALRYAPSLRALAAAESRAAAWTTPGRPLVVGNPAMPTVSAIDGRRVQLKDLPSARSEGDAVAKRFRVTALTNGAATETAVRTALPSAPLVHLATHGLAYGTEAKVRDSYVALAPDAKNDGLLTIGELLDDVPSLAADLVVLSACQTGLGDLKQAEGTVGFQRALLAKGARSVLVSLWSVDDRATALLMRRFYAHWLGPDGRPMRSKGEALRQAQADVRLTPGFESPRYWAAFQLVGAR
jgi:tetratricopeptide (TPR) repeat protein